MENSHNVLCLSIQKRNKNSSCISPDLLPDTSLKRWMYWWTMEKSVWKEKYPQLDVHECTLNCCHQVVCVQHMSNRSCLWLFACYVTKCFPYICRNVEDYPSQALILPFERVKWNWVKDLNKQWVEERLKWRPSQAQCGNRKAHGGLNKLKCQEGRSKGQQTGNLNPRLFSSLPQFIAEAWARGPLVSWLLKCLSAGRTPACAVFMNFNKG